MVAFGSSTPRSLLASTHAGGAFPWTQSTYTSATARVPAGSLDRWFAARAASSFQLTEVVWYGDSTMFGQTNGGAFYSPVQRVVELLTGDGYAYGGHGNFNGSDDVTGIADSVVVGQGFASINVYLLPGESLYSAAAGDNITFTRDGRYLTIWYSRYNDSGRFTYEIDSSGTEVAVDPALPAPGGVYTFAKIGPVDLGTDGTHTIKFRNKGGRIVLAPVYAGGSASGSGSGGSLTAGTYDYAAAFLTTGGKIGPIGATKTVTITSGQTYSLVLNPQVAASGTSTNFYRRVSGVGSFKLIGNVSTDNGSPYFFEDTGVTATTTYAQDADPVLNPAMSYVNVANTVTKATGIVIHNLSARGSSSSMALDSYNLALGLGLDLEPNHGVAAISRALDTSPSARRPSLVVRSHGINNQQFNSGADGLYNDTRAGIQADRYFGVDSLVTIPAFEVALHSELAPDYRAALFSAAEDENVPWVDISLGLEPGSTSNDPHLTHAEYVAQGDLIHDVLGAR